MIIKENNSNIINLLKFIKNYLLFLSPTLPWNFPTAFYSLKSGQNYSHAIPAIDVCCSTNNHTHK